MGAGRRGTCQWGACPPSCPIEATPRHGSTLSTLPLREAQRLPSSAEGEGERSTGGSSGSKCGSARAGSEAVSGCAGNVRQWGAGTNWPAQEMMSPSLVGKGLSISECISRDFVAQYKTIFFLQRKKVAFSPIRGRSDHPSVHPSVHLIAQALAQLPFIDSPTAWPLAHRSKVTRAPPAVGGSPSSPPAAG